MLSSFHLKIVFMESRVSGIGELRSPLPSFCLELTWFIRVCQISVCLVHVFLDTERKFAIGQGSPLDKVLQGYTYMGERREGVVITGVRQCRCGSLMKYAQNQLWGSNMLALVSLILIALWEHFPVDLKYRTAGNSCGAKNVWLISQGGDETSM